MHFTAQQHAISHAIVDYWTAFASGTFDSISIRSFAYDHDYNENREEPVERIPWHPYDAFTKTTTDSASTESTSPRGDSNNNNIENNANMTPGRTWLEFTKDAKVELRAGDYRREFCGLWKRLGQRF